MITPEARKLTETFWGKRWRNRSFPCRLSGLSKDKSYKSGACLTPQEQMDACEAVQLIPDVLAEVQK